jgi:hypothetical protein
MVIKQLMDSFVISALEAGKEISVTTKKNSKRPARVFFRLPSWGHSTDGWSVIDYASVEVFQDISGCLRILANQHLVHNSVIFSNHQESPLRVPLTISGLRKSRIIVPWAMNSGL